MTEPRLNGVGAGAARALPLGDDWISRRLREQDERITQNLAAMQSMVGPLQQAIADLTAQQAEIAALVGSQVFPMVGYASNSTYPIPSGAANRVTRATISFTVPSGYTRALVTAFVNDGGSNTASLSDYLYSFVDIASGAHTASAPSTVAQPGYSTRASMQTAASLSSLVGGASFTIRSQPYVLSGASWAAVGSNWTALGATVVFLR